MPERPDITAAHEVVAQHLGLADYERVGHAHLSDLAYRPDTPPEVLLAALTCMVALREDIDRTEHRLLDALRLEVEDTGREPVSWTRIGASLGMSRQGAENRHLRLASAGLGLRDVRRGRQERARWAQLEVRDRRRARARWGRYALAERAWHLQVRLRTSQGEELTATARGYAGHLPSLGLWRAARLRFLADDKITEVVQVVEERTPWEDVAPAPDSLAGLPGSSAAPVEAAEEPALPPMEGAEHQVLPLPDPEPSSAEVEEEDAEQSAEPAPATPRHLADGSWAPTGEQQAIIDAAATGEHLVVEAGAGTGKTSTLVLVGKHLTNKKGLYIAFNASIAAEARTKMPSNLTASTAHSLAFRSLGRHYKGRLDGPRVPADKAAQYLGITSDLVVNETFRLSQAGQAVQVMEMVRRFCHSAAREITADHAPRITGLDPSERARLGAHLLPLAHKAWDDLTLPDGKGGKLKFGHDHYLKMWALTDPQLGADFIALDEAQDSNPVIVDLVRTQDAQQIVVGDSAQQIYGWRGAVDALATWPAQRRLQLSQSWRFGERIASEANVWLSELGMGMRLAGNPSLNARIGPLHAPEAVLCRTNSAAVGRAMEEMKEGRKVALLGGAKGVQRLAEAARALQAGQASQHPELMAFDSWGQVCEYVDQNAEEAGELKSFVRLVEEYGSDKIIDATRRMGSEKGAQVVCGTAHKAKGREWGDVEIAGDFREPRALEEGVPGPVPRADAMLAYVTVTRAMRHLDNSGVAWIHDRNTRKG